MVEGIRLSKTPGLNAHWQETEPGHDGTHVAFDRSTAAALVAVAEAARKTLTCRQGVPAEVQQAQVDLMDAWKILADALAEAQAGAT